MTIRPFVTAAALVLAMLAAGCQDDTSPTDGTDMDIDTAEQRAHDIAVAGAERLGLAGEPTVRESRCPDSLGNPDDARIERRVRVLTEVDGDIDLTAGRDLLVSDYDFEVVDSGPNGWYLARDGQRAAVRRSDPGPNGIRNAWVEVTTGCFTTG